MKRVKKIYQIIFILSLVLIGLSTIGIAQDTNYPSSYDLRNINGKSYVTPVKNQNPWGTCWSFSNTSAAETSALLKGAPSNIDLSERSLAWFNSRMQKNQGAPDNSFEGYYSFNTQDVPEGVGGQTYAAFNNGGDNILALNQLSTWYGSNTEANAPYKNDEGLMTNNEYAEQGTWSLPYNMFYEQQIHLQNGETVFGESVPASNGKGLINNGNPEYLEDWIKQNMLKHGSIPILYYDEDEFRNTEHASYYCSDGAGKDVNHAVTVVGWDDNYPASNFNTQPPGNGAYIIKNSWGTDFGDEGYFYMSYYDQGLGNCAWLDVETPNIQGGYSYDNIYQYDFLGTKYSDNYNYLLNNMKNSGMVAGEASYASIFTADHREELEAVSANNPIPLDPDESVTTNIKVYVLNENYTSPTDGELVASGSTKFNYIGIHTVELSNSVELPEGTVFSVVETAVVNTPDSNGTMQQVPLLAFELGLENSIDAPLQGPDGQEIGLTLQSFDAKALPGQSFIKGLNGNAWQDVTSDAVVNNNKIHYSVITPQNGVNAPNKIVYGNALIKAYTTDLEIVPPKPVQPEVDFINLTPESTVLSTLPGNTNSVTIDASFEPEGAYVDIDNLQWFASGGISMQVDPSNLSVTVTALEEGYGVIECTNGAQLGMAIINVTNQPIIADSIQVVNTSPDYFDIQFKNVNPNPAFAQKVQADNLSVFVWSETNQSDINAKVVNREDGTNNFILRNVPVNDTAVNNYFINADSIIINAYANIGGNLYWLGYTDAKWNANETITTSSPGNNHFITYITYGQNIGFVKPSTFYPAGSNSEVGNGIIGMENSKHLEGVRISSNLDGIDLSPSVYSQGVGWIDGSDGEYTGTMWQNRPIEAIKLAATPDYQSLFGPTPVAFQYRAYIEGQGWTDYATVNTDTSVGIPNSGHPLLAIEVRLISTK